MTDYDPSRPEARRFPRVIGDEEIAALPVLPFARGIGTNIFLSRERDDARFFRQGILYAEADHDPYTWVQQDFDETHYVLTGWIRVRAVDADDREVVLEAGPGEHIYCTAGFTYTLEPHGVPYTFFWTSGPSPSVGVWDAREYSGMLTALRNA
ncbi:hypothetical protein [Millisia brevis]|uniref:hypothetical protein n=1 Tax=Millisia brevis TaxID=264148 RepID=UPI0008348002|nr:hypothetical protein [Millisia brevis]